VEGKLGAGWMIFGWSEDGEAGGSNFCGAGFREEGLIDSLHILFLLIIVNGIFFEMLDWRGVGVRHR
jgi:hypothetical protein